MRRLDVCVHVHKYIILHICIFYICFLHRLMCKRNGMYILRHIFIYIYTEMIPYVSRFLNHAGVSKVVLLSS